MRPVPWQARLSLLAAIWGLSFLFIKVGDEALAPLQVALGRTMLGTATLLLVLAARGEHLPRGRRTWLHLAVAALLFNAVPFTLFSYGELHTTSVLAGIFNAATPLFTVPFSLFLLPQERISRDRLAGVALGFAGVLIAFGVWNGLHGSILLGNALCLGAAASYGLGFPYTRKYLSTRGESVLALAAGQLLCGTVELALITPLLTPAPGSLPLKVLAAVITLGVLGTGIAYILNYSLIRDVGPTAASTVTYLIPLFSTATGILILREPLAWYQPLGGLVIITGLLVAQGRLRAARQRTAGA
ncbi:MAG TPA: DMT family transporter, partial [Chloroflexota bacterium]|nr:DMT family transporter [Chloroflexota bacterium]